MGSAGNKSEIIGGGSWGSSGEMVKGVIQILK